MSIPRWMWKTDYDEYIRSPKWKITRSRIVERAAGKCERCGKKCRRFQVHHLTYERLGEELSTDLAALCGGCHRAEHGIPEPKKAKQVRRPKLAKKIKKKVRKIRARRVPLVEDYSQQAAELRSRLGASVPVKGRDLLAKRS